MDPGEMDPGEMDHSQKLLSIFNKNLFNIY